VIDNKDTRKSPLLTRLQRLAAGGAAVLVAGLCSSLGAPIAHADGVAVQSMPSQYFADLHSSDPRVGGRAGWADMPGGVAARPYVRSLTVINDGVATPVITDGTTAAPTVSPGDLTTVVSALNLCRPGQTPAHGVCYATPNRFALTVGYGGDSEGNTVGWNFANPQYPVTPTIDANSVIDMTVVLNTLGKSLRWSWVNGDLLYWQTNSLGQDDATVHVKFRPATAPYVAQFPPVQGCTATPIFSCDIARADGQVLSASMVFSLDDTLDPALTGAAFATQNAIAGFLVPGGTALAPSLDMQISSTHENADGTPQLGTLEAFIPSAALLNLYGVLPTDATTAFKTTRSGDAGTNDAPSYTPWAAETNGSDGLFVTVKGITFSVPKYRVATKLKPVVMHARARGSKTTIKASIRGCSKKSKCLAAVYNLGRNRAKRFVATKATLLRRRAVIARKLLIVLPASKLKRRDRCLLVVRSAKHKKLLASTISTVRGRP
jgi:hypothetical protein